MYEVQKRDGKIAEFDIAKISSAIAKAFDALGKQYHPSTIDLLALNVTAHFEPRIKNGIIKEGDKLSGEDCREGLTCVISVKLTNAQFEGQTKAKLGNSEIRTLVEESFGDFFRRNVAQYAGSSSLPVHCVGSVAYFYREPLERAAGRLSLRIGTVLRSPIEGLIAYHSTENKI